MFVFGFQFKILTWFQGFRVKIANFSRLHCLAIPRRELSTRKTKPTIEKWLESLLESYQNFNISNVRYYFSLNCANNKIRESDWFSVSLTDCLIWLRQHQNCPILTFRLDACDQTCQIGQLKSQWKSSIKCCQTIRINKLVHASKSKPTKKLQWTILPASFWHIRFF